MMWRQHGIQQKFFYQSINLENRIRNNHILRKVKELIDFDLVYEEVKGKYGSKGNVSVPPVILKLMLLLVFYNVR